MAGDQICYTLIAPSSDSKAISEQQLKDDLISNKVEVKREALKELIRLIVNGEKFPNLLMTVIRFVMPSQDHMIKKLLLLFWEVVPKYGADGKLLHEMILVCDAYRRDLQHPNEFIRGSTLRFLCKLKEPEVLEPIMPAIEQCLEHRHAYVRRNAVLAIFTIYKNFEHLIPDAPDKILHFLEQEQDASCKRNAFMMLLHVSQSTALEYLVSRLDQVQNFGDILQLIVVELIYKVCLAKPSERLRFVRCVYGLLQSNSPAVRYEAAGTLITLSSAPSALKAAASCYISLIQKESDNNVKLIVLSRLTDLRQYHERILQGLVMDIVQILAASDMEIRQKTLDLCMDLVTSRTAEELIKLFRKELLKACSGGAGGRAANTSNSSPTTDKGSSNTNDNAEATYRYALMHTIYDISVRFPETLATIIPTVCDILTYEEIADSQAAAEACRFIREVLFRWPQKKSEVLEKLMQVFPSIAGQETLRQVLWIFGEFCTTLEETNTCVTLIRQVIGDLPLVDEELRRQAKETGEASTEGTSALLSADGGIGLSSAQRVTADGIYVTQTALTLSSTKSSGGSKTVKRPVLQAALFEAQYMPAVVLSVSLVKLFYRYVNALLENMKKSTDAESAKKMETRVNSFAAECMLIIASMLHLATSGLLPHQVNHDHLDRMWICLKVLADRRPEILKAFDETSRECLSELVEYQENDRKSAAKSRNKSLEQRQKQEAEMNRADAPIKFSLLTGQSDLGDSVDRFDLTLSQALGAAVKSGGDAYATSKLSKVRQLTGFSDPVYAEAYVNVNQFDIVLDVLIVNQTRDTLQNLTLELSTLGDLRLVEKPSPLTVAPQDFANIKANIKVSSTENGIIFGNISYDIRGSVGETTCIVLNDIHIDIMEYVLPATCSPAEFRQMWSEFEWENKVTVNTQITDLLGYLSHITAHTNLRCLTPMEALLGDCDYLCVTLYARTIFGEHVLANLCLEKTDPNQPVTGHVRIRAKTQGMAVTMGEKVSTSQKNWPLPGSSAQVNTNNSSEEREDKMARDDTDGVGVMRTHSPAMPLVDLN